MVKRTILCIFSLFLVFMLFQYFYGGLVSQIKIAESFEIVAHRGLQTNWKKETYDRGAGCEATHISPPTHTGLIGEKNTGLFKKPGC